MRPMSPASAIKQLIRIYKNRDGKYPIPKEYRNEAVYGSAIKALAIDLYSEGIMSNDRIASFMNSAGNFQSWQNRK